MTDLLYVAAFATLLVTVAGVLNYKSSVVWLNWITITMIVFGLGVLVWVLIAAIGRTV